MRQRDYSAKFRGDGRLKREAEVERRAMEIAEAMLREREGARGGGQPFSPIQQTQPVASPPPPPPPPQQQMASHPPIPTTTLQQLTQRIYAGGHKFQATPAGVAQGTATIAPVPNSSLSSSYLLSRVPPPAAAAGGGPPPVYNMGPSVGTAQQPLAGLLRPVQLREVSQIYPNRSVRGGGGSTAWAGEVEPTIGRNPTGEISTSVFRDLDMAVLGGGGQWGGGAGEKRDPLPVHHGGGAGGGGGNTLLTETGSVADRVISLIGSGKTFTQAYAGALESK